MSLGLLSSGPANAITIDDFSTTQSVADFVGGGASNQQAGGGILGGERDMEVLRLTGTGVFMSASGGTLSYGHVGSSEATGLMVWDGADGSSVLDPTGLGGVDLTDGGLSDAISMLLTFSDGPAPLTVAVYTDAVNYSLSTVALPGNIPPNPSTAFTFMFSNFAVGGGTGANFADVGAITLLVDGSSTSALDIEFQLLETIATPEPSTAILTGAGFLALCAIARRRIPTR